MKIRIISSLIIAAVLAAIIPFRAFNVYAVDVIVVIFMFMAAIEMNNAFRAKLGVPYFLVVLLGVPLLYLAYLLGGLTFAGGLGAALTLVLFATVCLVLFTLKDPERALRARATAFILIYPLSLMLFLVALNHSDAEFGLDTVTPVALVFFISCVSDVMALLVGITLKGPKLAPKISPKKTVSGAIGGLAGGLAGAFLVYGLVYWDFLSFAGFLPILATVKFAPVHFVVLGIVGSVFTQAGDLAASYIKRKCEIKDYGTVIPGHGGIMDRLDGILFNAVFIFCYLAAAGFFQW